MPKSVVTFDIGQTLVDLDLDFLARRLGERGHRVTIDALRGSVAEAWRRYDALTESGASHPWKQLMQTLLTGAGVADTGTLVDWLYEQQATHNLWRKPIPEMVELVRELRTAGVSLAALSNSEGHLAELLDEIGLASLFDAIIDSGRLAIAKPDPRIFELTLEELDAAKPDIVVHVGDSWAADVEGALAAGWHAIWFRSRESALRGDDRVPIARNAAETRAALKRFGVL